MKTFFIVEKESNVIAHQYDAVSEVQFGGPLGDTNRYETVELPEGKDKRVVKIERIDGEIAFIDDADKMRAINKSEKEAFIALKDAEAETAMMARLKLVTGEDMDYTTHLAVSQQMGDIYRYPADYSEEQVAEAAVIVPAYKQAWIDIRAIRSARDAAIASFSPTYSAINPLYPVE